VSGDSAVEVVGGVPQNLRKLNRQHISEQDAQSAPNETPPVALEIGNQRE
jgi:hypothetical protein